jgi:hypothetical protein
VILNDTDNEANDMKGVLSGALLILTLLLICIFGIVYNLADFQIIVICCCVVCIFAIGLLAISLLKRILQH